MRERDISKVDLNLLKLFAALIEAGSVTAAGERLHLAQSTVSHSLAKLRDAFNDPLFVRSTRGLQPTSRALALREPIERALDIVQEALGERQYFDPATSTRTFNLLMTDVGEMTFLPPLVAHLRQAAPGVRVVIHELPRQRYKQALENGTADLALGRLPAGQTDLLQQSLMEESFEGFARRGHPILPHPTLETFLAAEHLIVGKPAVAEQHVRKALGPLAAKRRIVLELRHYLPAAFVLATTDLVALLPQNMCRYFESFADLARFSPPFVVKPVVMRQFWHARSTQDPGCQWLRRQVSELFRRGPSRGRSIGTPIPEPDPPSANPS
jgi:DNA-binding transcriptional LysR family regulator